MSKSRETIQQEYLTAHLDTDTAKVLALSAVSPPEFNLNPALTSADSTQQAGSAFYPFHTACLAGDVDMISRMLSREVDPNYFDEINKPIAFKYTDTNNCKHHYAEITPVGLVTLCSNYQPAKAILCLKILMANGANPYCLLTLADGTQCSLFDLAWQNKEYFGVYIDMLLLDKIRLYYFLNQTFDYTSANGKHRVNILEASILKHSNSIYSNPVHKVMFDGALLFLQELYRNEWLPKKCEEHIDAPALPKKIDWKTHTQKALENAKQAECAYQAMLAPATGAKLVIADQKVGFHTRGNIPYFKNVNVSKPLTVPIEDFFLNTATGFLAVEQMIDPFEEKNGEATTNPSSEEYTAKEWPNRVAVLHGPRAGHTFLTWAALKNNAKVVIKALDEKHCELNQPVLFGPLAGMTPLIILLIMENPLATMVLRFLFRENLWIDSSDTPLTGVIKGFTMRQAIEIFGDEQAKGLQKMVDIIQKNKLLVMATVNCNNVGLKSKALRQGYLLEVTYNELREKIERNDRARLEANEDILEDLLNTPLNGTFKAIAKKFNRELDGIIRNYDKILRELENDALRQKKTDARKMNQARDGLMQTCDNLLQTPTLLPSKPKSKRVKVKVSAPKETSTPEIAIDNQNAQTSCHSTTTTIQVLADNFNTELANAKLTASAQYEESKILANELDKEKLSALYQNMMSIAEVTSTTFETIMVEKIEHQREKLRLAKSTFNSAYKNIMKCARNAEETSFNYQEFEEQDDPHSDHDDSDDDEKVITKKPMDPLPSQKEKKFDYDPNNVDQGTAFKKEEGNDYSFFKGKQKNNKNHRHKKPMHVANKEKLPKHELDKLLLCRLRLDNLKELQNEYNRYMLKVVDQRDEDDRYTMQLVCNMEHELLMLFETMLSMHENPQTRIFISLKPVSELRNLSKYGSFMYGENPECLKELVKFACTTVAEKVEDRIYCRPTSTILFLPAILQVDKKIMFDEGDEDLLLRRYDFMLSTLAKQSEGKTETTELTDRLSPDKMRAGAQLDCLLRIGGLLENANAMLPIKYSLLKNDSKAANSITFFSSLRNTPLLTYMELEATTNNDTPEFEDTMTKLCQMINNLTPEEMINLLIEFRYLESHKPEDKWTSLSNQNLNHLIDVIAKRTCALHLEANHRILYLHQEMEFTDYQRQEAIDLCKRWYKSPPFHGAARESSFFEKLEDALDKIAKNRRIDATIAAKDILNEFDAFAIRYLYSNSDKEELAKAKHILQFCFPQQSASLQHSKLGSQASPY